MLLKITCRLIRVSCSEEGEILAVDISISHKKLSRMILVYNPQFTNIMNIKILKKQLEILVSNERNIILLGDFNLPKLFTTEKFDSYNNISNKQYEIFKNTTKFNPTYYTMR